MPNATSSSRSVWYGWLWGRYCGRGRWVGRAGRSVCSLRDSRDAWDRVGEEPELERAEKGGESGCWAGGGGDEGVRRGGREGLLGSTPSLVRERGLVANNGRRESGTIHRVAKVWTRSRSRSLGIGSNDQRSRVWASEKYGILTSPSEPPSRPLENHHRPRRVACGPGGRSSQPRVSRLNHMSPPPAPNHASMGTGTKDGKASRDSRGDSAVPN